MTLYKILKLMTNWLVKLLIVFYYTQVFAVGEHFDITTIDDTPKIRNVQYPHWFTNSFLDLNEDVVDAVNEGKKGIMIYFGQKDCPYCEALMQVNFGTEKDIIQYTRKHFNVIPIDTWGDRVVTDFNGVKLTEKEFAKREKAHFTPSIIFFDADAKEILQLRGYYTPYKFRAVLEFVVDQHYKKQTLRQYMAQADPPELEGEMNSKSYFKHSPFILDRTKIPAQKPLAVFFEQGSCHACDILHSGPLEDVITKELLGSFEIAQLDMWSDTPVLTPSGEHLSASQWAKKLGLFYSPSLIFYDAEGKEIIRVSSVTRVFRLRSVLEYVLQKEYLKYPTFLEWRKLKSLGIY